MSPTIQPAWGAALSGVFSEKGRSAAPAASICRVSAFNVLAGRGQYRSIEGVMEN